MTTDEELLSGLGKHVRDEDASVAVLERLTRGEKVAESELAGIDPEIVAMFRPLDAAAEARIAEKIAPAKAPSNVREVNFRRYVPFLAAAAAVVLFFVWPRSHQTLPPYAFELSGNAAELRGDGPQVVEAHAKLHKEANLEIVLRPETKVTTTIAVHAALVRDGKARDWSPKTTISPEGAVRIAGPVKELFPDVNAPWEIFIAIGPESALPANADALVNAAKQPGDLRIVRGLVEFAP